MAVESDEKKIPVPQQHILITPHQKEQHRKQLDMKDKIRQSKQRQTDVNQQRMSKLMDHISQKIRPAKVINSSRKNSHSKPRLNNKENEKMGEEGLLEDKYLKQCFESTDTRKPHSLQRNHLNQS